MKTEAIKTELTNIRTVAAKELRSFFHSAVALIFLFTFLVVTLFTFFWVEKFFARNIADVRPMFEWFPLLLILLVGALTMRMWSEEQKLGTLEVLLTLPISVRSLVLGKFLAGMALVVVALALTLGVPLTVEWMGDLDWGPVIGGYLGALLLAGAYLSIGLCISSTTDNQVIALIFTILACTLLFLPGTEGITSLFGYDTADLLRQIGSGSRFESIARGVLDLRDVVYYAGIIALFLTFNAVLIDRKRWSTGQRTLRQRMNAWLAVALVLVNVVAVDIWLGHVRTARADLTENNEYSLSPATERLLDSLDEPLLIRAYISRKVHPIVQPVVPQIRDLLEEYAIVGGDQVRVEFVDPLGDEELEKEAEEEYGIETLTFKFEEHHGEAWVNAYFSILVKYGSQHQVLNILDMLDVERRDIDDFDVRLGNLEYEVSQAIKKAAQGFQDMDRIFAAIPGRVKLTAYLSPDSLPEEYKEVPQRIEKVAKQLGEQSGGKFTWEVVEPKSQAEQRDLVQRYGFRPFLINPFSNDYYWMHLLLDIDGELHRVVPGEEMTESDIKKSLTEVVRRATPGYLKKVGLWKPQGFSFPGQEGMPPQEIPPPQGFQFLQENLGSSHEVVEVELSAGSVPEDIDALVVAGPESLDERAQYAIDQFLMRGGTVILLAGRYRVKLGRDLSAEEVKTGLEDMLKGWGVEIDPKLVYDPQAETFAIPQVREVRGRPRQELQEVDYPLFVHIKRSGMSGPGVITTGLPDLILQYASPVRTVDPPKVAADKEPPVKPEIETLLSSSGEAWAQAGTQIMPDDFETGFVRPEKLDDKDQGPFDLGVVLTGPFPSHFRNSGDPRQKAPPAEGAPPPAKKPDRTLKQSPPQARLVIIGSSSFLSDEGQRLAQLAGTVRSRNNVSLALNLVDWAVADTELLSIRSRGSETRVLDVEEGKRTRWELINYGLVLAGLVLVAAVPMLRRRRMQPMSLVPRSDIYEEDEEEPADEEEAAAQTEKAKDKEIATAKAKDEEAKDEEAKDEEAKDEEAKDEEAEDEEAEDEAAEDEEAKDEEAKDEPSDEEESK